MFRPLQAIAPYVMSEQDQFYLTRRIAEALERMAPPPPAPPNLSSHDGFVWHADEKTLIPVEKISYVTLELLQGIGSVRDILTANTERFVQGLPANNALLWGARGMGKSSLVKAVHAFINAKKLHSLGLVEIFREDIGTLPSLLQQLKQSKRRFLLFCDDLSFDMHDTMYKSLKAVLDGGIEGRPENVLFYATSNRRHLMARDMIENEQSTAIHPGESVEEKVSLSDRFGLWLGFHSCSQETYLTMVEAYAKHFSLPMNKDALIAEALEWSITRGARSGRVAWQYIQDVAGRLGVKT